jgi:hypothetical protein
MQKEKMFLDFIYSCEKVNMFWVFSDLTIAKNIKSGKSK